MESARHHIISQLQKAILPLEGYKTLATDTNASIDYKPIENCFPTAGFPIASVHEFITESNEIAATSGFIAVLLGRLMQSGGVCIWISSARTIFPPALKAFGVEPHQVIFIDVKKERDVLWVMQEALKCNRLTAVVGEIKEISFKESRKLQLTVEQSRVTGFILRPQSRCLNTIACVARWCIRSLPSAADNGMPGVGFPRWDVALLKVRNGKTGNWQVEWVADHFKVAGEPILSVAHEEKRKAG